MENKIVYNNQSVIPTANMNITKLYSIITDLENRVKKLEKKLEKPKYTKLDKLFQNIGFSHLYSKFEKQKIDYETLEDIFKAEAYENLSTIIPTTGEYFKFVKKIKKYFEENYDD